MAIKIGNRLIGKNEPPYFIADIAANHDGDIERAFKLIELAKKAGADAAKFQNFTASKIVSKIGFESLTEKLSHQKSWKKSVFEVYEDASVSFEWTPLLKAKCDEVGIDYFTSPYDFNSVDQVDPFVELYKIGSGDITWNEIIEYIALKGKPVLIATGASSLDDVNRAMKIISMHTNDIVLMQCNTNYTASLENFKYINLNVLNKYKELYPNTILGLSDHTPGHSTVLGALALGAVVFEKHFTDDNNREGPDHKFAMNPNTWREMVDRSHELFYAMGDGVKKIEPNEMDASVVQRRSIRVKNDLEIGHVINYDDLESLRPLPTNGIPPYEIDNIIGKKIVEKLRAGQHVEYKHLES